LEQEKLGKARELHVRRAGGAKRERAGWSKSEEEKRAEE
jgi:hypothetical protein